MLSAAPVRASSAPTSFFTSGRHDPHAAPARVHAFTPATSVQPSSVTAQRIVAPEFLRSYQPDLVIVMNSVYVPEITAMLASLDLTPEVRAL